MYTEQPRRLPNSYMPWTPPDVAPPLSPLPALTHGFCTFGVFQKPAKLTPRFWGTVAAILHRVPSARLLIHQNSRDIESTASPSRQSQLSSLSQRGIDPARISFAGIRDHAAHFDVVATSDVALDTFPYSGTTTTGDCLWMGVPVITLTCQTHAGRVGYSMLSRLGLEQWAASTEEEYVNLAVRLASDTARLANIRSHLRDRMRVSVLTDARAVMAGIEKEYKSIWKEHVERDLQR